MNDLLVSPLLYIHSESFLKAVVLGFSLILSLSNAFLVPSFYTELEVHLRQHCQKLRVHKKLSGAHILIPGESTLAIRAYYPIDLKRLETESYDKNKVLQRIHCEADEPDVDGLQAFQKSFAMTVIFFVLSDDAELQRQLDNASSFLRRAQRLLERTGDQDKTTRVLVVQDTQQAVQAIFSLADSMSPAKRQLKQEFFQRQRQAYFLPSESGGGRMDPSLDPQAASYVASAIREWADVFELPAGEADVLMGILGSLGAIATANDEQLARVPVEDRTKAILHMFFGSPGSLRALQKENSPTLEVDANFPVEAPLYSPNATKQAYLAINSDHPTGTTPPEYPAYQHEVLPIQGAGPGYYPMMEAPVEPAYYPEPVPQQPLREHRGFAVTPYRATDPAFHAPAYAGPRVAAAAVPANMRQTPLTNRRPMRRYM